LGQAYDFNHADAEAEYGPANEENLLPLEFAFLEHSFVFGNLVFVLELGLHNGGGLQEEVGEPPVG